MNVRDLKEQLRCCRKA